MKKSDDVFRRFEVVPVGMEGLFVAQVLICSLAVLSLGKRLGLVIVSDFLFLFFGLENGFESFLLVWLLETVEGWVLIMGFVGLFDWFDFVVNPRWFGIKRGLLWRGVISLGVSHGVVFWGRIWIVVLLLKGSQIDVVFLEYFRVLTLNLGKPNVLFFKQISLQILNLLH